MRKFSFFHSNVEIKSFRALRKVLCSISSGQLPSNSVVRNLLPIFEIVAQCFSFLSITSKIFPKMAISGVKISFKSWEGIFFFPAIFDGGVNQPRNWRGPFLKIEGSHRAETLQGWLEETLNPFCKFAERMVRAQHERKLHVATDKGDRSWGMVN